MQRNRAQCISFGIETGHRIGLAEPGRILQHRLEHWGQIAGELLMT